MPQQPEQPSKIVMLAPIALVLMVYSFMFFSPQRAKLLSAQERFADLSETNHQTEHEITDVQQETRRVKKELRELASQIDEVQQEHAELTANRHQMLHQLESHARPAATMERVTGLMEKHKLRVVESQQDSSAANQAEMLLKSIRDLLKDDESQAASTYKPHHNSHAHFAREVYKLKVRGRFQDLRAALETLKNQFQDVLPLSLQMESMELDSTEARQSDRIWTLTIMV